MIRKTLKATKEATLAIVLPNLENKGRSSKGTGFFVSPDGWFVTAAHVVTENNEPNGPIRSDISKAWLMKESRKPPDVMYQTVSIEYVDSNTDFALLKVDFEANRNKVSLKGKTGFPYIEVSSRELDEGEPVYSFGYPLSDALTWNIGGPIMGIVRLSPRVTSAVISSTLYRTEMIETSSDPKVYVLDKALNYGNSGGPIVATETGKACAFCSRFQPVYIPQEHLKDRQGNPLTIMTPSLYGVVSSLANPTVLQKLNECGVPISDD
jgi:serine protease Do